jgi:transcriptional regulator with XRE-family HTH domain
MQEHGRSRAPYRTLGSRLKSLREQQRESVAEVSGAVEIDAKTLERIEQGVERPSEEILILLIQHFDMADSDAMRLWEVAGYSKDHGNKTPSFDPQNKQMMVLLALDARTVYSDGLEVTANQAGVVMNFLQEGLQAQSVPIARVGMSYAQAETTLKVLQQALLKAKYLGGPKALPPQTTE